ncbi:MAG: Crp/Fnr family transcriptional regulator [Betaproteobacteria bacterium RIFCSPLOWO2_02_FULL_67_26]|nr:MAG: Crp/Fnr family transcriptional regulator [Betaproteobacteria bacterium RIFCSPLOWO2_02_FULL_67_26]
MPAAIPIPVANSLLAALPRAEYERLISGLEQVKLAFGEVLYQPGEQIRHAYFPNDCLVSLFAVVEDRTVLEVGLVGSDGMVGVPLALGIGVSPVRALVQGSGAALRMESTRFGHEFNRNPSLRRDLFRYTHSLMAQAAQTAVCSRFHLLEARLARLLLMTRDRMRSDDFRLTHEFLAQMLGVRRVGVTKAAGTLQQRNLIRYSRGGIRILDRKGLEAASCRCYQIVKNVHDRTQDGQSNRKTSPVAAVA